MFFHNLLIAIFLALCTAACPQFCWAQQTESQVSISFVSFPKSAEPIKVKLAISKDSFIDIEAPSNWLSKPIRVPAISVWLIGRMEKGPDGKTAFKELGRAKSLLTSSQIILLVQKGKDDTTGFDVLPLDAYGDKFRGGHFLFMNAARVEIGGIVGDQKFAVKPGHHTIIKPLGAPGERNFRTVLYYRQNEVTTPFSSTVWPISNHARSFIFFYHDPASQHLRMHSIRDFPGL